MTTDNRSKNKTQKYCQPSEQLGEVHTSGTKYSVELISFFALQPVAVHTVFLFHVTDSRLYGSPAFHPTPETTRCSASTALVDVNIDCAPVVMASITHIDKYMLRPSCNRLYLFQGLFERVAIVRIAMKRLAADYPTSPGGGCKCNFAAELVALMSFTLTDTFNLGRVNTV